MAIDVLSVARRLSEVSDWTISVLHMQKMCYMAHMYYMGECGKPLVEGNFEAWEFGPIHPKLYHEFIIYGDDPVPEKAFKRVPACPDGDFVKYLVAAVEELPRRKLFEMVRWKKGAWEKNYEPEVRGRVISNEDIVEEYNKREAEVQAGDKDQLAWAEGGQPGMAIDVLSAARRLGEKSGWTISNMQMQRMCYMAHMYYLGEFGRPFIKGVFEAWGGGPVHPKLYQELEIYDSYPVPREAFKDIEPVPEDHPGAGHLDRAVAELPRRNLIGITVRENGAWRKNYDPKTQRAVIYNEDIIEEYNKITEEHDQKADNLVNTKTQNVVNQAKGFC